MARIDDNNNNESYVNTNIYIFIDLRYINYNIYKHLFDWTGRFILYIIHIILKY